MIQITLKDYFLSKKSDSRYKKFLKKNLIQNIKNFFNLNNFNMYACNFYRYL